MRVKGTKTELPRRIVTYYLLFSLLAICSLGVGVAVARPDGLAMLTPVAHHTPIVLLVPIILLGAGGLVLYRTTRPLAKIESQLRQAAALPSLPDASLHAVQSRCAAALGWNRIVDELSKTAETSDLGERLAEAVRDRRNQQVDDILNSFPEGVATTDAEGRITFANQAVKALLACDEQETDLVGAIMQHCLGIEFGAEGPARPLVDPVNLERTTIAELQRPVGHSHRVLRVARHPIGNGRQPARAKHIWSVRDVTQHKLAEKMRDDFLDSATHELRTPLANIKAYSEALSLSEVMDVEQQKDFCNTINSEATRLARLIDDLLSISSLEVGSLTVTKQRVELDRLLAEVISKVTPQMKDKNMEFQTILPEKMPQIKLDKDKIGVALINLLGNAAKYTAEGGRVALTVKEKDNHLIVNVEDSGVGISREDLSRVFEKFFRSADARVQRETGTGLGLSLAHEIVRLHGGTMTVESELDKGTTFTMTLPLK